MRILYFSDLHGCLWKYEQSFKIAVSEKVDAVINGGDMLPDIYNQKGFIEDTLDYYFKRFDREKIYYLCMFGNDDLRRYDGLLDEMCEKYEYVKNIAMKMLNIEGYDVIGFNLVKDYPFTLKDRCRRDNDSFVFGVQYGRGFLSTIDGWQELDDWVEFANGLPTIEEELKNLPVPKDTRKAIYVIHMPPSGCGLDVCMDGRRVGSDAVYEFLKLKQPLISLHGHIHENFKVTGGWRYDIGNCVSVQPGQLSEALSYVLIDVLINVDDGKVLCSREEGIKKI